MIFLDTSLVARVLLHGPGHEQGRRLLQAEERKLASVLLAVEFRSAAARRRRAGAISARHEEEILARFQSIWVGTGAVPVSPEIVAKAGELVRRHPLRTLDAIHLATSLIAGAGAPGGRRLATVDARLAAAARAEGLEVLG